MTNIKQETTAEIVTTPVAKVKKVKNTNQSIQPTPQPNDPNSLIAMAVQQGASVETLERLFSLHEKVQASTAKAAFTRAMALLQSELPTVKKLKAGDKAAYAPLEDIVHETKATLLKNGFAYRWNTSQADNKITVTCIATHVDGHSEETVMTSDEEEIVTGKTSGAATKSAPQRTASTITFLKRYTYCNMFGVTVAGEDFDGRMEKMQETKPKPNLPKNPKMKIAWLLKSMNYETTDAEVVKETIKKLTGEELVDKNLDEIVSKLEILWQERQENN